MIATRRAVLAGLAAAIVTKPVWAMERKIFDCHFHIIDPHFPLIANQGFTPDPFPVEDYLARARPLGVRAGCVVAASFQGFDQTFFPDALRGLGTGWVGAAQVPPDIPDAEIVRLAAGGVRSLCFNIYRGKVDSVDDIVALATRAHAIAGWHAEIYADAAALRPHVAKLSKLPQIVIDHLGMTESGLPVTCDLVAAGAKVKASGFGRVSLNVPAALEAIAAVREDALVFGTDMPSTRARRPFEPNDIDVVIRSLGAELAQRVFWDNGLRLYRVQA